jgi:8-oxo-dGTP diphosphatase
MNKLGLINPRNVSDEEALTYKTRVAARAIVMDAHNKIALLHVTRDNYFKLPGGGVEEGEDMHMGLTRECREEIGCDVEIGEEVGMTTEYWKEDFERQTSHCFLAHIVGEKGMPELTASEQERGFETVWLTYADAISTLRDCVPTQWEGDYIIPRELLFLEAARSRLASV